MKIDIGPPPRDLIPAVSWSNAYNYSENKSKLVVKALDLLIDVARPVNKLFRRPQKVKIKYHNYDTWSLDHTLALIIVPGLKQLKATNHGYGHVDDEDLPTVCLKDASGEERWEWLMDELIWTFNQIAEECTYDDARIDNGLRLFGKYYRGLWD
jgi:hypothetical protein